MSNPIRFEIADQELFGEASHDRSLLHLSEEYASRTRYGEPIVFGILGAFAALGTTGDRPDRELKAVSLQYLGPMYRRTVYEAEAKDLSIDKAKIVIGHRGRGLLSAVYEFRPTVTAPSSLEGPGTVPLCEQARWQPEDLREGVRVSGRFAASAAPLLRLVERWGLARKGAGPVQLNCLLWSSYLTGMQLPGVRGTSARLRLEFRGEGAVPEAPLDYEARVVEFDPRFGLLHTAAALSGSRGVFADAEVWAHIRPD